MRKELPYFQFYVDHWLSGKIQMCSMEEQGIFVNLLCLLWRNNGVLDIDIDRLSWLLRVDKQVLSNCLNLLVKQNIVACDATKRITVKFLEEQLEARSDLSIKRSLAGSKGGKAKAKQMPSKCQANAPNKELDIDIKEKSIKEKSLSSSLATNPPSLSAVLEYAKGPHCNFNMSDEQAEMFLAHYNSIGWVKGDTVIRDWRPLVNMWKIRESNFSKDDDEDEMEEY